MSKKIISVDIDSKTKKILEKRAKKELMSLEELAGDILRRSAILSQDNLNNVKDNVDDRFLTFFSRKNKYKG